MKIVKDDENHDIDGLKNNFIMHRDFHIIISVTSSSIEEFNETMAMIPHSDEMMKFVIHRDEAVIDPSSDSIEFL